MYKSAAELHNQYGIARSTLRSYAIKGTLKCIRLPGKQGKRLYHHQDLVRLLGIPSEEAESANRLNALYARVSSSKQKRNGDLQRQIELLQSAYPSSYRVFRDVASGLNFKRKGLQALLELVLQNRVGRVVVLHRDRLCRFAFELMQTVFKAHGTEIVVHGERPGAPPEETTPEPTEDLKDDLMAVTAFFVARYQGGRAAAHRLARAPQRARRGAKRPTSTVHANSTHTASPGKSGTEQRDLTGSNHADGSGSEPKQKKARQH